MGAANCCKKPDQIVIEEIKDNGEGDIDKINVLDQDSYPQDTELVHKVNINSEEDNAQQEVSYQKLYEQKGSPNLGGAYEVAINASSPEQYNQGEGLEKNQIYSPTNEAQNQGQSNSKVEGGENNEIENQNIQQRIDFQDINEFKKGNQPTEENKEEVLNSQKNETPNDEIIHKQEIQIQQQQDPQAQIQVKEADQGEDINKYFQISTEQFSKFSQNQNANANIDKENQNIASVIPVTESDDDINKYFKPVTPVKQTPLNNKKEDIIKNQKQFNLESIINMKDLPETFGSSNINNYITNQQKEIITTVNKTENINPLEFKSVEINTNESLPETFGSNNINNFKQTTTTTKTETTGNVDLKNFQNALTTEQINNIINMKDLPETFGSSNINNFKQTTTTTKTETTGKVDLGKIPTTLTSTEINNIINMKDLPETFGSSNINNFKQTTTTTKTETTGNVDLRNLPAQLTSSQINNIINMKDLPETFGSSNINNMKKTTVTTTTTTVPSNNNQKQTTTTTTIKTTGNQLPIDLKQFGLESSNYLTQEPIDLKQFGLEQNSSAISTQGQNKQITTVTKTLQNQSIPTTSTTEDYSKYFQQGITQSINSNNNIDLKQFGLEKNASGISNIMQGSNITFQQQPKQSVNTTTKYGLNQSGISPAASTPITMLGDYNKYFQATKTTTTALNPSGVAMSTAVNSPNINLNNFGLSNAQQKTTTTTTTNKTTGIPITSGTTVTQNYVLPPNYTSNKVTTTKVTKSSYTGPTQTTSYNYSYAIPTKNVTSSYNK